MAEIKHTFQAGKMNKDVDERLVPNGEYRDALNIEVRTSDGDDVGTAQLISGNIERLVVNGINTIELTTSWYGEESTFVGSIANERTNKAYFFISAPSIGKFKASDVTSTKAFKDVIVEYDTVTKKVKPVVVDIFEVHTTGGEEGLNVLTQGHASNGWEYITVSNTTELALIRPGMSVRAYNSSDLPQLSTNHAYYALNSGIKVKRIDGNKVYFDRELHGLLSNATTWRFTADPTLNFHRSSPNISKVVTGINIIDGMLFWTDNYSEPKKINIERSIAGTPRFDNHTKLYITNPQSINKTLASLNYVDPGSDDSLREEHITVIKRAPRFAPKLEMSISKRSGNIVGNIVGQVFVHATNVVNQEDNSEVLYEAGTAYESGVLVNDVEIFNVNYKVEDVLILTSTSATGDKKVIRAKVETVEPGDKYDLRILSVDASTSTTDTSWDVKLEQQAPLFEMKFGRFGYRYKYQDGEYSSFSPWSELAFLGGALDYVPIKGYNLGMVNNVRELKITDFIVEDILRPDDVVCVDILYKDSVSPNVYLVKSIERGKSPEWDNASSGGNSGVLNITSEMIHRTLPNSQALRAWDNVPRIARAQEVTGNRVVYANYLQNYDVNQPVTLKQGLLVEDHAEELYATKSIKSIRKYKIGVVFGDKYGRETPVLGMGGLTQEVTNKGSLNVDIKSDVHNPKKNCHKNTKLTVKQMWTVGNVSYAPSDWMEYFKYYVKETTNDYYNLVMDRWYNAEDGNIWLSFQSADRNKVDIETYLILKNQHGTEEPVLEEARYKILAIKNEAPDFIKTTQKILGDLEIQSDFGNALEGIPTSMSAKFDENGWTQVFNEIKFKGIGYARIKGQSGANIAYSKWVKISRMNDVQRTVTTIEPFGDSANMITILDSQSAEYFLQIKDNVVENKPEFDGRFFIKIYKDASLSKNVLFETSDDVEYFTTHSFKHAYIRNNQNNPATNGSFHGQTWVAGSGSSFSNSNVADMGKCAMRSETKSFWENHGSNGFSEGATWFLDQVRARSGGYETRNGLYSRPGISGKSAMDFSVRRQSFPTTGDDLQFQQLMSTPGTYFRFRSDPNNVVYEVKGTKGGSNWGKNYPKKNLVGKCVDCDADWGSCNRKTFGVYFTRADNPAAGVDISTFDPRGALSHTGKTHAYIDIVTANYTYADNIRFSEGNAIWETEPKEDVGLDLYYEASSALPMNLTHATVEQFAPKLSKVICERPLEGTTFIANNPIVHSSVRDIVAVRDETSNAPYQFQVGVKDTLRFIHDDGTITGSLVLDHYEPIATYDDTYKPSTTFSLLVSWAADGTVTLDGGAQAGLTTASGEVWEITTNEQGFDIPQSTFITGVSGATLTLTKTVYQGSPAVAKPAKTCKIQKVTGYYKLDPNVYKYSTDLGWFNCYSFGNGLESDRIRDDFNAPTMDNGVKVSTTLDSYGEEKRGTGLIYSGIYNSMNGVNRLNEFNMAEKITKDLNPSYGTIQALKSRDTNLVTFCEDKVLQILANKDALFNADGSTNVTASNAVLGDAKAFVGDYGISSNPESLAVDSYRMYFTDKQRGKVLRLSQDGLTPISDVGMTSWFRKYMKPTWELLGTFDEIKGEYNLSLKHTPDYLIWGKREEEATLVANDFVDRTLSFSEKSKGWVSFKSFIPQTGLSINDEYVTCNKTLDGFGSGIWKHHEDTVDANTFYGDHTSSTIDVLFNDEPGIVKGFATVNYEGSQAKITADTSDGEYYNLSSVDGWNVSSIKTDKQEGSIHEFKEKEGKWFNHIFGEQTTLTNLDTSEFSVQGIGVATNVTGQTSPESFILTIEEIDPGFNETSSSGEGETSSSGGDEYILLNQNKVNTNNPVSQWNVVVVGSNEITFDGTYSTYPSNNEWGSTYIYMDSALNNMYSNSGLSAGTSVTLSGKITRADNTNTWNNIDTNADGWVEFRISLNDKLRVFIDEAHDDTNNSAIEENINSSGVFTKTFTLQSDVSKFQIVAANIKFFLSGNPGVRISNLSLTT